MKIQNVLFGCFLVCASIVASGQANPASGAHARASSPASRFTAQWAIGLALLNQTAQAPPALQPPHLYAVEAQAPPEPHPAVAAQAKGAPKDSASSGVAPPTANPSEADSPRLRQSNDDYAIWRNDYLRRLYENQLRESWIIFALVLVLVFSGLFFSWLQFQHAFLLKQVVKTSAASKTSASATPSSGPEEFTFGKDGVVVRSAYLGVIILAISMAFFFLYIKYVYLIS